MKNINQWFNNLFLFVLIFIAYKIQNKIYCQDSVLQIFKLQAKTFFFNSQPFLCSENIQPIFIQ